jgi:hypothetical protein
MICSNISVFSLSLWERVRVRVNAKNQAEVRIRLIS